jgi:hypothetical protein
MQQKQENQKPIMSQNESLDIISQMIAQVKNSYLDDGFSPILWGASISILAVVSFIIRWKNWSELPSPYYLLFFALAWQIYYNYKQNKNRGVKSWSENATDKVWLAFGICMLLGTFGKPWLESALGYKVVNSIDIFAIFLLYGFPTFVTGSIFKFKPMVYGGIMCWVCAIAYLYVKGITHDFYRGLGISSLFVISACSAWLIPGIILRLRYLKAKKQG